MKNYKTIVGFHGKLDNNLTFIASTLKSHSQYKCVDSEYVALPDGSMTVLVLKRKTILDKIFS